MVQSSYLTAPVPSPGMPRGIPYIIGNEAAERFSYYGMRAILVVFMTNYLMGRDGTLDTMTEEEAKGYYHLFVSSTYFFPVLGAILSDVFLGKYRTIISLSVVYCLGHLALALDDTRVGLAIGLTLIAIGSGGIKPCVSAHVGDQFGAANRHLLEKVFGWFYFSINFGSFLSTLLTPWLLQRFPAWLAGVLPAHAVATLGDVERVGAHVAFGVPGLLMLLATVVFWMGRHKFVHIPPRGWEEVLSSVQGEGGRTLLRLVPVFACVAVFWSLYDQTSSAWILQAGKMDRVILEWEAGPASDVPAQGPDQQTDGRQHRWEPLPSQVHALNPILILVYIPLFAYVIYPLLNRVFPLTPLRKVSIGFFVTAASFAVSAWIEQWIVAGFKPHIAWQGLAYMIITAGEVMVSITCLEFSYTQAPNALKSLVMSLFLLSVSAGNLFTSVVNFLLQDEKGGSRISGPAYYWFFCGLMLLVAIGFIFVARAYRGRAHLQDEGSV